MVKERKNNRDLLDAIGQKYGVSAEEVRRDMESAIADVCSGPASAGQEEFKKRFGNGVPSLEEVIYVVAKEVKKNIRKEVRV